MDACVQTFLKLVPETTLPEVIRMATLTPARILGVDDQLGTIEAGKLADLVVLDSSLEVQRVYLEGREIVHRSAA